LPSGTADSIGNLKFTDALEKATNGMVKSEWYWAAAMGQPAENYEMVTTGVADLAVVSLAYTPGVFPMTDISQLLISLRGAPNEVLARAHMQMYDKGYYDEDLADVKVLALYGTSYVIYWAEDRVDTIAEFKGKKVRSPTGPGSTLLELLGAIPVSVPSSEAPSMLQKKTIDATYNPWDAVIPYKMHELCKYVTELGIPMAAANSVFMNKATWEKLPEAAKKWIDDNWREYACKTAAEYDIGAENGKKVFEEAGGETLHLSAAEQEKLEKLVAPMWDAWIAEREAKGLPAKKYLADLYEAFQKLGVKEPFVGYRP
jgi:TRAP-type C4-dicarboxylate transport system substrate-binding protein